MAVVVCFVWLVVVLNLRSRSSCFVNDGMREGSFVS